jgi:hypothetical protein
VMKPASKPFTVGTAYHKPVEEPLWEQLRLDTNDFWNVPANKTIMKRSLDKSGDLWRSNPDGTLRRVNMPDGTPIEVSIHLEPGASAHSAAYRVSKENEAKVAQKLYDLKREGSIEEAPFSHFSSSLLVQPKPHGDIRMTVDYRKLNQSITQYTYPLSTPEDIFNRMAGATRFSVIDFSSWFYQFALAQSSRDCTTFVTPMNGAWRWKVLPMGLNISPQVVQFYVDEIFRVPYTGPGKMHG